MKKPKILYCRAIASWICIGNNVKEYGDTPNRAYNRWRVVSDIADYVVKNHLKNENKRLER